MAKFPDSTAGACSYELIPTLVEFCNIFDCSFQYFRVALQLPEAYTGLKFTTVFNFVPTKPANINPLATVGEGASSSAHQKFKAPCRRGRTVCQTLPLANSPSPTMQIRFTSTWFSSASDESVPVWTAHRWHDWCTLQNSFPCVTNLRDRKYYHQDNYGYSDAYI